jgi:hypothetical protein
MESFAHNKVIDVAKLVWQIKQYFSSWSTLPYRAAPTFLALIDNSPRL